METAAAGFSEITLGRHDEFALYELTVQNGDFRVSNSLTDKPFDYSHYSEFKYGKRSAAELFGRLLAEQLLERLAGQVNPGEELVVLGTPYKNLPNAARLLAITVERHLRAAGLQSSYSRIYQDHVGEGVYGTFTQAERDARNGQKNRFFDPRRLAGRHIVVVDDIRITGSVQRSILKLLDPVPKLSLTIVSLAQLDPEVAKHEPQLENKLNHQAVQNLNDVLRLMSNEYDFALMTRVVRYVLQSTLDDLQRFLDQLRAEQVIMLYEAVIDERYDQIKDYRLTSQLVIARRNSHP